jgi:flagellar biogenesis protein FliO
MRRLVTASALLGLLALGAPGAAQESPPRPPSAPEASAPAPAPAPAPALADPKESFAEDIQELRPGQRPGDLPEDQESFTVRSVLWMFAALGFIIAVIYLSLNFGLRRLMGIRPVGGVSLVQVLDRVPLDQKKSLYVLRAAGEYLLVGGTDGALNLISKLDTQEVERLEREARTQTPSLSPFLQKLLARRGGPPPPSA